MPRFRLAIEISNPSSGPRGLIHRCGRDILAGPGVAIAREDDPDTTDTELLHDHGRHDDDLMPAIDRLCRRNGAVPSDLAAIAVSIGPGGYTSLRIAIATAKLLAEATGAVVVPVESWRIAAATAGAALPVLVCLASKNNSAWAALLPEEKALGLITVDHIRGLRPRTLIADRFLPEPMRIAAGEIGAAIIEPAFSAAELLSISRSHAPLDVLKLAPLYPREADAVTQWRRLHPPV